MDEEIREISILNERVRKLSPDKQELYHKVIMEQRILNQQQGGGRNVPVVDRWDIIEMIETGKITDESLHRTAPPKEPPAGGTHAGFSGEAMDRAEQEREDMMRRLTGKEDSDTQEGSSNP